MDFFAKLHETAEVLSASLRSKKEINVRLITSLSADGICSAAIFCSFLKKFNIAFSVNFVKHVTDVLLKELKDSDSDIFVFCDIGVGRLASISTHLSDKKHVFVFEHHLPRDDSFEGVCYVNPNLHDIDGTKELSTSGLVYLLLKHLNFDQPWCAGLALVGAVGDAQERNGFFGLNKDILEECAADVIDVVDGVTLFGAYTKPLVKVIEQSLNPFIPGVTGNPDAVIRFLKKHDIPVVEGRRQKWLKQLSKHDVQRLLDVLGTRVRHGREALLGKVYLLHNVLGKDIDLREYSALLNSCARCGEGGIGFGACFGDKKSLARARTLFDNYNSSLLHAILWFYQQRGTDRVVEKEGYVFINAEGHISDQFLGTVLSLISRANVYEDGTIILALAYTLSGDIHISSRLCGRKKNINLRTLLQRATSLVNGDVGGHSLAAGGLVKADKEEDLLKALDSVFSEAVNSVEAVQSSNDGSVKA